MQLKIVLATAIFLVLWDTAVAQESYEPVHTDTVQIKNVKDLFLKGEVEGHVRNYLMATINHRSLPDNYANAIGAALAYRTASFHGFRFGFTGLFTYNLFSSELNQPDPISEKHPKLELELFDVQDPGNSADLDRLDELYVEYKADWLEAKAGRFSFNSPLMNPQDTRMKPYSFQGINLQFHLHGKGLLTVAWFNRFSPRSTVHWYKANETIGIFSRGVNEKGSPSDHSNDTSTRGVAVTGFQLKNNSRFQSEVWNYWIENVSNNTYGKTVVEVLPRVKVGVEGLYQIQVGNGGNQEASVSYFPDQHQWLAGGMFSYEPNNWILSLNYLHTGRDGQFLFPREWGREQFFATISRGRMEGTGNSDLLVAKAHKNWSPKFFSEVALGKAWLPGPENYRFNKYGATSYWGWVANLDYKPANPVLDGLNFRLLYIGRVSPNSTLPLKDMYYNTNFHNFNFVTQITF